MQAYHNTSLSMGTRFNLILPGVDDSRGEVLFSSIMEELIRIENMLSCFMPESDISKINNNACNKPVEVNHELLHILTECLGFYERTKGAFDIGIGKIIDHWSEKKTARELEKLINGCGADKILIDHSERTVRFATQHVKINLGGYGKGYALKKIQDMMKAAGVTSAYISFGESSVSCIGKHPHGEHWSVGIQDIGQKNKSIASIRLINQSVSTSGNMGNAHPLIHPQRGTPVSGKKMITVRSVSAITAEILSTALMTANKIQHAFIRDSFQEEGIIEINYENSIASIHKYNLS